MPMRSDQECVAVNEAELVDLGATRSLRSWFAGPFMGFTGLGRTAWSPHAWPRKLLSDTVISYLDQVLRSRRRCWVGMRRLTMSLARSSTIR
jgi:hypothetical protein